jgi:LysR family transcriptional regulator, glycine cleavage system transcriptional activator
MVQGAPRLQPRRWLYLNFTYQQVQAALAGQGIALARVAMITEALARGDLVEPFGAAGRVSSPFAYWLVTIGASASREEVRKFCDWLEWRAMLTREAMGDVANVEGPTEAD